MNFITATIIGFFAITFGILFTIFGFSFFPSTVVALIITAFTASTLLRFKDNLFKLK